MLPLTRQGYTATQIEAALRDSTGSFGCRFELLDVNNALVGHFKVAPPGVTPTDPGTITAATVDVDVTRKLVGSLELEMLPDDRLRDVPFQFHIKAYFLMGMPDGGVVEFAQGVFTWAVPERDIAPGVEVWKITLADGLHDLDAAGPGPTGFQVWAKELQTDAIARIVNLGGFTDTSGIQATGATFAGPRSWGLQRPQQGWGFMFLPDWQQGWGFYFNGRVISVGGQNPNATRTTTLLDIALELHTGLGYDVPWMSVNGVYTARPFVDWTKHKAVVTFGTGSDSITVSPLSTTNDLSKFCNRVACWSEASGAAVFFVQLDANDVVPGHPLSQARIRKYADRFITDSTADSEVKAEQQARKELLDGLSMYQKVEFTTLAWPVMEPFDLLGVVVTNDAEFGTLQLFQSQRYAFDLFTGEMKHEANRVYQVTT